MDKVAFLTMDVESYFDTTCIQNKGLNIDPRYSCAQEVKTFLDFLNKHHIKGTFFVNANFVKEAKPYLLEAIKDGHEIGLHCLKHESYKNSSPEKFEKELVEALRIIKDELGVTPVGYRFPCFEYNNKLYKVLKKLGFIYDSSVIGPVKSKKKFKDTIYLKEDLVEFSPNYIKYLLADVRLSGGSIHRVLQSKRFNQVFDKYLANHNSYLLYLHPFELYKEELPIPKNVFSWQKQYLNKNRDKFLDILENLLSKLLSNGFEISNMKDYAYKVLKVK